MSASIDWDRVERTLGCDLAFLSMPPRHEGILVAAGLVGTRDSHEILRDCSGNFYVTCAMTLSRLHSRFPTCVFVVPLDLDVSLCVGTFELVYF